MTLPDPARYRTTNWKSYNEALKRRGSLLIWLDKDMVWLAPKVGANDRPPVFSGEEDEKTVRGLFSRRTRSSSA